MVEAAGGLRDLVERSANHRAAFRSEPLLQEQPLTLERIAVERFGCCKLGRLDAWGLHIPEKLTPVSDQHHMPLLQLNALVMAAAVLLASSVRRLPTLGPVLA